MSRTPVPFAPDTLESIRRAFRVAAERRHDLVSLEHMLHALLEAPQARNLLTSCRLDLVALRKDLEEVLERAFTLCDGNVIRVLTRVRAEKGRAQNLALVRDEFNETVALDFGHRPVDVLECKAQHRGLDARVDHRPRAHEYDPPSGTERS